MASKEPSIDGRFHDGRGTLDSPALRSVLLVVITLAAYGLRVLRLEWQPLWWDEGYSVFFATEPLSRMLALTARDIHPPLYYAVLHGWTALLHNTGPAALRLMSIAVAVVAIPLAGVLAGRLSNRSTVAIAGASLLLAVNPLHIYYSQEIRMYSLATSLGIASSVCLVTWLHAVRAQGTGGRYLVAYVALTVLLLGTLYYSAILIAVQLLWATWAVRRSRRALLSLLAGVAATGLLFLPWAAYALPKLASYVADKVAADQDTTLAFADYVSRHVSAFVSGHELLIRLSPVGALAVALAALVPLFTAERPARAGDAIVTGNVSFGEAIVFLTLAVGGSLLAGFLINLRFPFFPSGGERLLLFALPYFLTLVALGLAFSRLSPVIRTVAVLPLVGLSLAGVLAFYMHPRHADQDYRQVVRTVEERGSSADTVLALFPWQVGYWRAYGLRDDTGRLVSPQPAPVGQEILVWDDDMQGNVDGALEQGVLWFPEPLSLGSDLPQEIEGHLENRALNIENRWETAETRLTAWTAAPADGMLSTSQAAFGPLTLTGYSVQPQSVPGDNGVLAVTLEWGPVPEDSQRHMAVSLVDSEGNVWSERVYTAPHVEGSGAASSQSQPAQTDSAQTAAPAQAIIDRFGIQAPAGMPPGTYEVRLSVLDDGDNPILATSAGSEDFGQSVLLQRIEVTVPAEPVSPVRISFDHRVDGQQHFSGVKVLGVADIGEKPTALAGSDMQMKIGLRSVTPDVGNLELFVALVDAKANASGPATASWQGWPLPDYPLEAWPQGTIVLVPVTLPLSAEMREGTYKLVASLVENSGLAEAWPVELATVQVIARPLNTLPPSFETPLTPPVQFGTHAMLVGYDAQDTGDGVDLLLTWEVMQPLRPQHHIFVHLVGADGALIAQQDGSPETSSGPAPTGSWRAGETITTEHHLPLSALGEDVAEFQSAILYVGLYDPDTGIRLPASIDGTPNGDSAIITLSP